MSFDAVASAFCGNLRVCREKGEMKSSWRERERLCIINFNAVSWGKGDWFVNEKKHGDARARNRW